MRDPKEIKAYLKTCSIKQVDIAKATGIQAATLSNFLNGNLDLPMKYHFRLNEYLDYLDREKEKNQVYMRNSVERAIDKAHDNFR